MNIELRFLQKAIKDKNYISFRYEGETFKKEKPLKLKNDEIVHTENREFKFSEISKLIVLKDRF